MLCTINYLADFTGLDKRTVKKRLANLEPKITGGENRYESDVALQAIFNPDALNPGQEKARLDKARREIAELQLEEKKRTLIPSDVVQQEWEKILLNVRARLLQVPTRIAAEVPSDVASVVESKVRDLIYEALRELARGKE